MVEGKIQIRSEKGVMQISTKHLLHRLKYPASRALYWARQKEVPNWGDDLNPWLFEKLTGRKPVYCPHPQLPRLLMAGSILEQAGGADTCWGSGFIQKNQPRKPQLRSALAVRGPLSAAILSEHALPTTKTYGDPGLLAADFVAPITKKTTGIVVVPHYVDQADGVALADELKAKVVPVSSGIEEFVQKIAAAEVVYSSSLHGLICAEALGIAAVWIRLSDGVIGGDFKFHDYILGTDRELSHRWPVDLRVHTSVHKKALAEFALPSFQLADVKDRILKKFPFNQKEPTKSTIKTFFKGRDF